MNATASLRTQYNRRSHGLLQQGIYLPLNQLMNKRLTGNDQLFTRKEMPAIEHSILLADAKLSSASFSLSHHHMALNNIII